MFLELLVKFVRDILPLMDRILFFLSIIFIPVILVYLAILLWVYLIQLKYIIKLEPVLLEIKIPKDISKSPLAMEIIFGIMQQSGAATYTQAYLDGKVSPWFSLELVSIEGQIHFFMWASEKRFKPLLEAQIYAQYPTVEVYEIPNNKDYVKQFVYDKKKTIVWGLQFNLDKKDVYPIKTYTDFNMDEDLKEEFRIDPMATVLEYLGSIGKGQQVWIQILIKRHRKEGLKYFRIKEKPDWNGEAKKEIEKIRADATPKPKNKTDYPGFPNPTKGEIEKIAAIERSISKLAFDTCIRGFYVAKKENFNASYISGLIRSHIQYNSNFFNGFGSKTRTDVSDEYKDLITIFPFIKSARDARIDKYKDDMFAAYRLRSFFAPPYKHIRQGPFVLSTEELATIYHFPGNVSATPTLAKIASKKSEPPPNLPIKN